MLWSTNIGGYRVKQLFFHAARVAFRLIIPEWNAGEQLFCVQRSKNPVKYQTGSVEGDPFCIGGETGSVGGHPFCAGSQTGSVEVHPFCVGRQTGSVGVHPFCVGWQTGSVGVHPFLVKVQMACAGARNFCANIIKSCIKELSFVCTEGMSRVMISISDVRIPVYYLPEQPLPGVGSSTYAGSYIVPTRWQPWMFVRD